MGINKNPKDWLEVIKLFVENGQDVNAIGFRGQSILIRCVAYRQNESVQYLLDHTPINLNIRMTRTYSFDSVTAYAGDSALDIARRENMEDIVAILERVTFSMTI